MQKNRFDYRWAHPLSHCDAYLARLNQRPAQRGKGAFVRRSLSPLRRLRAHDRIGDDAMARLDVRAAAAGHPVAIALAEPRVERIGTAIDRRQPSRRLPAWLGASLLPLAGREVHAALSGSDALLCG